MQIFRHFPLSLETPIGLTIGNFDGVHIGHQALIQKLIEMISVLELKD